MRATLLHQNRLSDAAKKVALDYGRIPVQRNTFYEPVKVWDDAALKEIDAPQRRSKLLEQNLATA